MSSKLGRSTPRQIDAKDLEYHRQRLRETIFEEVVQAFAERFERNGFKKSDLAAAIGRSPSLVNKWLNAPTNWTIDTISDVLLAIGAEMQPSVTVYDGKTYVKQTP